jgi:hypothetical protein
MAYSTGPIRAAPAMFRIERLAFEPLAELRSVARIREA